MRERVDVAIARQLPRAVAERNGVLPLAVTGRAVASSSPSPIPTNVFALDDVRAYLRVSELEVAVTTDADLRSALTRVWSLSDDGATAAVLSDLAEENTSAIEAEIAAGIAENDEAPSRQARRHDLERSRRPGRQ